MSGFGTVLLDASVWSFARIHMLIDHDTSGLKPTDLTLAEWGELPRLVPVSQPYFTEVFQRN
ncbi:MAG: hypothetical protein AAGF94_03415 [Pseudomonadota bacterium]